MRYDTAGTNHFFVKLVFTLWLPAHHKLAASIRKFWKNLAAVKTARCEIDAPTSLQPDDSFEKITSLGKGF